MADIAASYEHISGQEAASGILIACYQQILFVTSVQASPHRLRASKIDLVVNAIEELSVNALEK
ncbi:MAG: hypothetical protein Q9M30_05005 [Mariprofundaceae bacterium]|nr:hypothetical protein [Mariprofundaceae bacterium]